jgi:hypothetical protein
VNQAVEVKICSDFLTKTGWLEKQQIPPPETSLQLIATLQTISNHVCMTLGIEYTWICLSTVLGLLTIVDCSIDCLGRNWRGEA